MRYIFGLLLIISSNNLFGQAINPALENEIRRRVDLGINPSISIGVLLPNGSSKFYGFGYFDHHKIPPDSLTLYEIGSVTKTFTATLAQIHLKSSINQSLPIFFSALGNPNLDSITPSKLRNHIAGVPRLSDRFVPENWSDPFNGYSSDILKEELKDLSPDTTNTWRYSNFGYAILGQVIEIVTGKPYNVLMGRLLEVVGMQSTFLKCPTSSDQNMAQPTNIGTLNSNWNFTGPSRYAGGLVSCTKDLLSYLKYQKQTNPLFILDSIQKPIQTKVPNLGKDKLFYKDGWFIFKPDGKTAIVLHNGGTGGFISFIGFNKHTGVGVVVLSNSVNVVDDIGINILDPSFKLNHPKRTIAYELAENIDAGASDRLVEVYNRLKKANYPNNIIDVYWLERFHYGKGNYAISVQLSNIMVQELPEDWEVYDLKGQNLEQLKHYQEAKASYEKALELHPKHDMLIEKIKRCAVEITKSH